MTKKGKITAAIVAAAAIAGIGSFLFLKEADSKSKLPDDRKLSIGELNQQLKNYTFTDTDNFSFECDVPDQEVKSLYVIKNRTPITFGDNKESLKADMIRAAKNTFDVQFDTDKMITKDYRFEYQDDHLFSEIYSGGTFVFYKEPDYDALLQASGENRTNMESYVDLLSDDCTNENIEIQGQKVNIRKAAENALRTVNDELGSFMNPDERLALSDAIAVKNDEGNVSYLVIRLAHTVDGIAVNENGYIDSDPESEALFVRPAFISVIMTDENNIISLENRYYYDIVEKNEIKELIGLAQAVNITENGLAPEVNYKVRDVSLNYSMISCGKDDTNVREMHPMWSFILEYYETHSFDVLHTKSVYVDALDGCLYYCDSKKRECYKLEADS